METVRENEAIRAFISHTHKHKESAVELKRHLGRYGFDPFVAHEDIEPLREWQDEIVCALHSMDVLIALLTDDFRESQWVDQEIGAAIGRDILVIPVRMGRDPYGFVQKYQAVTWRSATSSELSAAENVARCIFEAILRDDGMHDLATDMYISSVARAQNFKQANYLAGLLECIFALSATQETALVDAYNKNFQARNAWGFHDNIVLALERITTHRYRLSENTKMVCRVPSNPLADLPFP